MEPPPLLYMRQRPVHASPDHRTSWFPSAFAVSCFAALPSLLLTCYFLAALLLHYCCAAAVLPQRLRELDIEIFEEDDGAGKDYTRIGEGDVVIFPAFGATVQEMQLFKDKGVKMVDTTCPWVAKVGLLCLIDWPCLSMFEWQHAGM